MSFDFSEGDRVDYVPKGMSQTPGVSATSIGAGYVSGAYDAENKSEGRHRAVIDKIVDQTTVRIILTESMDTVWAHPMEIEQLDVVSKLGDLVGPESRSFKDGLEDLDED
jgi:hypothetical protein